jgi:2-amino-4-hydroxy-6-hydroxymethyldihydropteridine diphosphokinase
LAFIEAEGAMAAARGREDTMNSDRVAIIALGSNLGDSRETVRHAMDRLENLSIAGLTRSSLYCSQPVDCPPGSSDFINAVVASQPHPEETPESLLTKLQALEREFGRQPKRVMNEARPLDLDLISFGAEMRNGPRLILPHPRAHLRRFVLAPLTEIAPDFRLPGQQETVAVLLDRLPPTDPVSRVS